MKQPGWGLQGGPRGAEHLRLRFCIYSALPTGPSGKVGTGQCAGSRAGGWGLLHIHSVLSTNPGPRPDQPLGTVSGQALAEYLGRRGRRKGSRLIWLVIWLLV